MIYFYKNQESLPSSFKPNSYILGKVDHIIDGDSLIFIPISLFHFFKPKSKITLRLAGIDAPETPKKDKQGQPFSIESKEFLSQTLNKFILIQPFSKDQYGRLIGMVHDFPFLVPWIKRNVCLESLRQGLSIVYRGMGSEFGNLKDQFLQAQQEATQAKRGVWSLSNFETPGQFKKKRDVALVKSN